MSQFEETLAADEPSDGLLDYEDGRQEADQSLSSPDWDRETPGRDPQDRDPPSRDPQDGYRAQKNRLQDLLVSARSKSLSGCFGARIDRIGTSSGLGCGPKRGMERDSRDMRFRVVLQGTGRCRTFQMLETPERQDILITSAHFT
ncbi:natriuretic peptides A precursor-like [Scleropages formosus]|uniref:Natriuretic peptides A-like n=1 Tax=Scleropages formosus TaxID=113540 RepID=A0A0P7YGA0_SCLFO|nr:natriuretic peptides A precursor-like [Scleropages formosus]